MPEFHYHDGSAVRKAKELHYHDGTAVRKIKEAWYHDGTALRKIFSGDPVLQLANHAVSSAGGQSGSATYTLTADGRVQGRTTADGETVTTYFAPEWAGGIFDTSVTSLYEALLTFVSGTNSSGGSNNLGFFGVNGTAYGAWTALSTSPYRTISRSAGSISGGTTTCTFDVTIRKIGTTAPTATARITISAQGVPA